jgi:hypothetical protein
MSQDCSGRKRVSHVEVFLGLTRGFNVLAGAVVLLSSPSHATAVGTAEYMYRRVRSVRWSFQGGLHGRGHGFARDPLPNRWR